jgi:starch synthase
VKLLYVNYGAQSGVVQSVTDRLRGRGKPVRLYNPAEGFFYKKQIRGVQVPNLRPDVVRAILAAMVEHGEFWKPYFFHTCFAFDRMTDLVGRAVARLRPDVVLQAGVLFSPGRYPEVPYYLYCDHTRAIAERYEAVQGLPPPLQYKSAWRARERSVYRNAAGIFVMSAHVRTSLVSDYGIDPARVRVVGAGPNVEAAPGDLDRRRERAFLFVGLEFVPKGGRILLQAFAKVRERHPDVKLWIAGVHAPETPVPGVTFAGRLNREQLRGLYATASWFVLPTFQEAFGLAYLEAMSFALPCIGSAIEAIPEIIEDGRTGLLVPPGNVDALAKAMITLVESPQLSRRMGEMGIAKVHTRFGWSKCAERILEVLDAGPNEVAGRRMPSAPLQQRPRPRGPRAVV